MLIKYIPLTVIIFSISQKKVVMAATFKKRPLVSILIQIPAYLFVAGAIPALCNMFYEIIFYLRHPEFKYLFAVDPKNLEAGNAVYIPTPYYEIREALRKFKSLLKTFDGSIFIDIGCGTGRVLFVASLEGYRHVIGVEESKNYVK
jgi:hypothetical protein